MFNWLGTLKWQRKLSEFTWMISSLLTVLSIWSTCLGTKLWEKWGSPENTSDRCTKATLKRTWSFWILISITTVAEINIRRLKLWFKKLIKTSSTMATLLKISMGGLLNQFSRVCSGPTVLIHLIALMWPKVKLEWLSFNSSYADWVSTWLVSLVQM